MLAEVIGAFVCLTIALSCAIFILGSMRHFKYQPQDCEHPVCHGGGHDATSGGHCACHPEPKPALMSIEKGIIIIFTLDYALRMLTVHGVPVW